MVSTLDSESNNPSSNLGRTFFKSSLLPLYVLLQDVRGVLHWDRIVILHESASFLLLLLL